ncbi:MAG: IS630 family transposase [Acidobacteria bacterium Pan2503]|uniref:IS630 family transposase n=1 Tax=Candidatus Acidiferrum panamense TaxID=2741543 RepID=A0A7V8NS55_9BACT|nr:IS630 family transposase [Candidatus Acidoferrum panamensis]
MRRDSHAAQHRGERDLVVLHRLGWLCERREPALEVEFPVRVVAFYWLALFDIGGIERAVHDQRTQSTYLFGAVCPERGAGAALVLPACNTEAMQLHLDEIATKVTPGAHAIVLLDQAGWHGAKALKVPNNISLLQLPPRAPELNGQENIWQFMRQNWLSNRIFKSFDDIVDHCCYAWNTLIDQPWKIMSIARRDWAAAGHSI